MFSHTHPSLHSKSRVQILSTKIRKSSRRLDLGLEKIEMDNKCHNKTSDFNRLKGWIMQIERKFKNRPRSSRRSNRYQFDLHNQTSDFNRLKRMAEKIGSCIRCLEHRHQTWIGSKRWIMQEKGCVHVVLEKIEIDAVRCFVHRHQILIGSKRWIMQRTSCVHAVFALNDIENERPSSAKSAPSRHNIVFSTWGYRYQHIRAIKDTFLPHHRFNF